MATTNGETPKCATTGGGGGVEQLTKQRAEVLVRTINNLLALDPKPENEKNGDKSAKQSVQVSSYIRKIDKLIDRIDHLWSNDLLDEATLEKLELYRGRLEERVAQLGQYMDNEDGLDDTASNELAVQRRELLLDDVDAFLRISPLNIPTNRRQALIDKGDRYIERLENLGYYHLQDPETLKVIKNAKRDIHQQIMELTDTSSSTRNTWTSDSVLNEQRMEILFKDIEQYIATEPKTISAGRRSATVQKGDKLIEKLLQYGYYHLLTEDKLQKVQQYKQDLEKVINDISKLLDEQPNSGNQSNSHGGNFTNFRRQHSSGFERQHSTGSNWERNY